MTVRAPRKLLRDVMLLCDGAHSWQQVVDTLAEGWSAEAVAAFLLELSEESVLVESGQLWAHWSEVAQVPQSGAATASAEEIAHLPLQAEARLLPGAGAWDACVRNGENPLARILQLRESFRTFDEQPLSLQMLCSILWAAHGVVRPSGLEAPRWHRTVGSGGNMHSARWFVAVLRPLPSDDATQAALAPAVYEARFHTGGGTSLQLLSGSDSQVAWACLRDPRVLRYASALVLPLYDIAVPARKYGNRATLFAMLEAGLSLQNAQLMAASLGAACMLRGDTIAEAAIALAEVAQEGQHWLSVPGMVVGAMPSPEQKQRQPLELRFKVGPHLQPTSAPAAEVPRFAFAAVPADGADAALVSGSGRAADPRVAMSIAEAEAWERVGWSTLARATEACFDDLPHALDPRELVAYSARQHRTAGFPFPAFERSRMHLWTEIVTADTGAARAVPAECVYALRALPPALQSMACTSSSTSGVAAGTSAEDALMRATLELVERDAFCCSWLSGRASAGVHPETLPGELRRRLEALAAQGAHACVIDLSTSWCAVVAVFLQAKDLPFTAVTAAAAFDAETAVAKALSEAEGRLAFAQRFPPAATDKDPMRAIERYYRRPRTFRRSDFFRPAQSTRPFTEVATQSARDWQQMRSRVASDGFDLLVADITPAGAAIDQGRRQLTVVRALVPGLVPIWFQAGLQPGGLRRFSDAGGEQGGRPAGNFLHPFT